MTHLIVFGYLLFCAVSIASLCIYSLRPLQNSPKSPKCLGGNLGDFGGFWGILQRSQADSECVECGYTENADVVGAINILERERAIVQA